MTVHYDVVGTQFTESEAVIMELKPGEQAWLVREPANLHDAKAVAVYVRGHRIGYVPRYQNKVLADHIDAKGAHFAKTGRRGILAVYTPDPKTGKPGVEV